jgi:hypothetical protein
MRIFAHIQNSNNMSDFSFAHDSILRLLINLTRQSALRIADQLHLTIPWRAVVSLPLWPGRTGGKRAWEFRFVAFGCATLVKDYSTASWGTVAYAGFDVPKLCDESWQAEMGARMRIFRIHDVI